MNKLNLSSISIRKYLVLSKKVDKITICSSFNNSSIARSNAVIIRVFSEKANQSTKKEIKYFDYDDHDDFEEPKTAGEAVALYSQALFNLFLLGVGIAGIGILGYYLWPARYKPYSLYSEAFDMVRYNDEIVAIVGEGSKAFGRDTGSDSRRSQLDSRQFTELDTNRTRIRFNVQGPKGKVMVWAEVTDKMPKGEFVFLICQDRRTGKVITIQDNRDRLEDEYESTNPANSSIFSKILGVTR